MKSNSSLGRAPFAEQLTELTDISLPDLTKIPYTEDQSSTVEVQIETINHATDQVLEYFSTGRSVLSGLDSRDDVEWMFEGRQAVLDVGKTIMRAGDVMNHLMTALENSRQDDRTSGSLYLPVVEKIEQAITEWHDILGLVRDLRSQIDVATEWKDFHDQILTEVEDEIDTCFAVIFEIEEQRHCATDEKAPDLDVLSNVMDESPFLGHAKMPNMTDFERQINSKFIEIVTRVKPLKASLEFIPLRLEQYTSKAKDLFPASIAALQEKYRDLQSRWETLNQDIHVLEKELGEDRWLTIFRNTGAQADQMLDNYQDNLKILREEKLKHHPDIGKIERYQSQNAYLVPAITRIVALFDRALKDRLTVNGEMYNTQARLHKRWQQMEQPIVESQIESPLTSKDEGSSGTGSNRSSFSSGTSPYSSLHSSPTISSVKPISFKLNKPHMKRDRTSLESCVEINPLRGLGRPNNTVHVPPQPQQQPPLPKHSRMSLIPVPTESPRPMYHVQPPAIPESFSSSSSRRQSQIPLPKSRQSMRSGRCYTALGHRRTSSVFSEDDTPRCLTPRPESNSRVPRPSSRLSNAGSSSYHRPQSQLANYYTTPKPKTATRKTSMPPTTVRRNTNYASSTQAASMKQRSIYQSPPSTTARRSSLRPNTVAGNYANHKHVPPLSAKGSRILR